MPRLQRKSFDTPDQVRRYPHGYVELVTLDETTMGRFVQEPGWRWSTAVKPIVGTDSCQVAHVGYAVSGRLHVVMDDGAEFDIKAGDAYELAPGHDAWVEGNDTFSSVALFCAYACVESSSASAAVMYLFMSQLFLVGELQANENQVLGSPVAIGSAALERRVLIVCDQLRVAVPVPVHTGAPGLRARRRTGRVREGRERIVVYIERMDATDDVEGALERARAAGFLGAGTAATSTEAGSRDTSSEAP